MLKTLCFLVFLLFASKHRCHRIPLPFLLSQHAVKVLVVVATGQWLLGFVQRVLQILLTHLALGQPVHTF